MRPSTRTARPAADKPIATVPDYLASLPEPARTTLIELRATLRKVLPKAAVECISYQMPAFRNDSGVLVSYAAFKRHCSLFPMSGTLIEEFKQELSGYITSKGSIHFPLDKPLPATLLRKLMKARIAGQKAQAERRLLKGENCRAT